MCRTTRSHRCLGSSIFINYTNGKNPPPSSLSRNRVFHQACLNDIEREIRGRTCTRLYTNGFSYRPRPPSKFPVLSFMYMYTSIYIHINVYALTGRIVEHLQTTPIRPSPNQARETLHKNPQTKPKTFNQKIKIKF